MWYLKYRRRGEKGKLKQRAFLSAGGAQVKDFAGKEAEILSPAFWIGALYPSPLAALHGRDGGSLPELIPLL
jgi:hypothetical protein